MLPNELLQAKQRLQSPLLRALQAGACVLLSGKPLSTFFQSSGLSSLRPARQPAAAAASGHVGRTWSSCITAQVTSKQSSGRTGHRRQLQSSMTPQCWRLQSRCSDQVCSFQRIFLHACPHEATTTVKCEGCAMTESARRHTQLSV